MEEAASGGFHSSCTVQGCGDNTGIPSSNPRSRDAGLYMVPEQDSHKPSMYERRFPDPDIVVDG